MNESATTVFVKQPPALPGSTADPIFLSLFKVASQVKAFWYKVNTILEGKRKGLKA